MVLIGKSTAPMVLALCLASLVSAQHTPRYTTHSETFSVGFLEYLPPGYLTDTARYPVIIYLHGGGEAGTGTPADLERVKSWGPPSHIEDGEDMCFTVDGKQQCF